TTRHIAGSGPSKRVFRKPGALHFLDVAQESDVDSSFVHDVTGRVGTGHHSCTERLRFGNRIDGYISGTGHHNTLAVKGSAAGLEHLLGKDHRAIACGFRPDQRATPGNPLAGEDPGFVTVCDALVLAEEEADLAPANAHVTCRNIGVLTDMPVQLGHERLAEPHDLGIRASAGIEVGTALAAADRHACEGIFEDLLKAEKLDDSQVDGGVEPESTFVGTERRVKLHPKTPVYVDAARVVGPRHAEDDLPFRFAETLQHGAFQEFGVPVVNRTQAFEDFGDSLMELLLARIPRQHVVPDSFEPRIHASSYPSVRRPAARRFSPAHGCTNGGRISIRWDCDHRLGVNTTVEKPRKRKEA